jgi:hypothetical protein
MSKAPFSIIIAIFIYFGSFQYAFSGNLAFGDFDLVIGCPLQSVIDDGVDRSEAGAVTVIYADSSGLGLKTQAWHAGKPGNPDELKAFDNFGDSVAVGDFNGDGVDDLAIASPRADLNGINNVGAVTIIFGAVVAGLHEDAAMPAKRFTRETFGDSSGKNHRFGAALAAGDFDNNGADDLAIGVPGVGSNRKGMAYVLYGPFPESGAPIFQSWSQKDGPGAFEVKGKSEGDDRFGSTLATGDFDGDGFDDLAVGVPGEDTRRYFGADAGAVNIIYGSTSRLQKSRNRIFTQDTDGIKEAADRDDEFGFSLAVGNFNGDMNPTTGLPIDDLAIGVPSEDFNHDGSFLPLSRALGHTDHGKVQVLYGSPEGLSTVDQVWSAGTVLVLAAHQGKTIFSGTLWRPSISIETVSMISRLVCLAWPILKERTRRSPQVKS